MVADQNPSSLSDLLNPELAGAVITQAVFAGRVAGIPDVDLIMALVAAAGTLARAQPDVEGWQELLPKAVSLAMEVRNGR